MTVNARAFPLESVNEEGAGAWHQLVGDRVLVCLIMLALYGWLMQRYPIIYGGDPVARLVNFPRILNGHQLPLLP